jgi:phosphonate transport system substrate-binding protein
MGAMITPKDGYIYYQRLQKYIEKKLGQPVQLVDRGNYDEMNGLLESGSVDAAFVCSGPYVEGKTKFGMELLAMPQVKGKPIYHSYIIVHKDSPIRNFQELRGKTFAFTDPKSNSGKLVPTYMLARMNETPESYFSRFEFTYGHDKSIRAVAEKLVDGAAVDSLIWEFTARKSPQITDRTKVISKSEPYGIPPVVVRPGIDPGLKKKLLEILLSAADDPEGKEILDGMMIDRFVAGDDRNYDTIRTMNSWVAAQRKKGP